MQAEQVQDETENFLVATSDLPEEPKPQEEQDETEAVATADAEDAESSEEVQKEEVQKEEVKKPKKSRSQKRIETLSGEKNKANERIAELEAQLEAKTTPKSDDIDPADFNDFEDYEKALNGGGDDKKSKPAKAPLNPEYVKAMENLQTKFDVDADKYEDFDTKTQNKDLKITDYMVMAFNEVDNSTDVVYYYASNQEEAEKVSKMTPTRQAIVVAKKAADLLKKPFKKTTKAPEPFEPVGGDAEYAKNVNEMSFAEFEQKRNADASAKKFW